MTIDIEILFNSLLKMMIPVVVGAVAAKIGFFKGDFSKKFSDIVMKVCQPFLIVTSIISIEYSEDNLKSGLTMLLLSFAIHAFMMLIAFLCTFKISDQRMRRVSEFAMIFANIGFFGVPLVRELFGNLGVFWAGFYLIPFNVLIWSYGIFILSRANPELKIKPVKIFINAGTVPCFIGFILFILRVRIYAPVLDSMTQIGAACTPLSMFIVGAMLVNIPIKRLLFTKETWLVILVKNLVIPLGVGVLMRLFGFSREISYFCALMASLPTAAATAMFAESYDIRPDLAAQSVGLTTVISLGTTPFAIWLLSRIFALI